MNAHRRRGGAAIEFALVLPVLLTLLFGILEYGWLFLQQANVLSAVREGVRLGVTYDTADDPEGIAEARVAEILSGYGFNTATASIDASITGSSPDAVLTVSAELPYEPLLGLYAVVPDNLHGEMTMLLELQD